MASSFIDYNNNGFWIKDGMLEPALSYLFIEICNRQPKEQWLTEMGEHIKHNSWGYFSGFMDLKLDKNLNTEQRRKTFLDIIDNTVKKLKVRGNNLDIIADLETVLDEENKIRYRTPGFIERDRVISVLSFLRKIVNGEKVDDSPQSETMMI